jgi:hypothetical protein
MNATNILMLLFGLEAHQPGIPTLSEIGG